MDDTAGFISEWAALRPTEQRQLVGQILRPPLRAALHVHKASTARSRKRARSSTPAGSSGDAQFPSKRYIICMLYAFYMHLYAASCPRGATRTAFSLRIT